VPVVRLLRILAVSSVLLVPAAGCGEDTPSPPPSSTPGTPSTGCSKSGPTGLLADQSITVAGAARSYTAMVPEQNGASALPLVFVLHGSGGTGAGIRSGFAIEAASQGKAIFVYPDAAGSGKMWDLDGKADANADVALFDALLASFSESHCVDRDRVFVTGFSAGGYFSNQLACRRGDVIRALASFSGGGPFGQDDEYDDKGDLVCAGGAVAALIVHGADDQTVGVDEGRKSRDHWRRTDGCAAGDGDPREPSPCKQLSACSEGSPVVYCEIPGLGHSIWPANGAKLTWDFFASF
jgi:polyhydroxybutyrate depolymerase